MFLGMTALALKTRVHVAVDDAALIGMPAGYHQKTVVVQVAEAVFSGAPLIAAAVALSTALILVLAANTAFNGFPVLGSILSSDGFLPRQLHTRGDRLAYSNGIIALAALAMALVWAFNADVNLLIPLYTVGVFVSFTVSQFGMIRHWSRLLRDPALQPERSRMVRSRAINTIGFAMTGSVLTIVLVTKFALGAWIACIAMVGIYALMRAIRKHYDDVARELRAAEQEPMTLPSRIKAVVLVSKIHKPTLRAIAYARATRASS
jgi:amino acid transporter